MLNRRRFLQAGSLASALAATARARHLQSVGFQLYTLRSVFPKAPAETLQAVVKAGYKEIEATYALLPEHGAVIAASPLKRTSIHLDNALIVRGTDDQIKTAIDLVKKYGFEYAISPYVPPEDRKGVEGMRVLADKLNHAAEKFKAAGIRFGYHNHAFEFDPKEGTTPWQTLLDRTDKNLVAIELDVFWVSVAGHDPVKVLESLKGRVRLIHLKDKMAGTENRFTESVPPAAFKEVGSGVLDWPKILNAAAAAGVTRYYVEQDQSPDPVKSLQQSIGYLSKLNY